MKFENLIKKYEEDYQRYATDEDKFAITNELTQAEVSNMEHTSDNRWLDTSLGRTVEQMRQYGYNFVGYCLNAPWQLHGRTCAIVIEDSSTFEKYWCHTSISIINWWKEQARVV